MSGAFTADLSVLENLIALIHNRDVAIDLALLEVVLLLLCLGATVQAAADLEDQVRQLRGYAKHLQGRVEHLQGKVKEYGKVKEDDEIKEVRNGEKKAE